MINSAWNRKGKDSEDRKFELGLEDEQDCRTENKEEEWSMQREGMFYVNLRTLR